MKYWLGWTVIIILVALSRQECVQYKTGECIRCDFSTRLYQNDCFPRIPACVQYLNENQCKVCDSSISVLQKGGCVVKNNGLTLGNLTLYDLAYYSQSSDYLPRDISACKSDAMFVSCDNYLRSSQYKHFISRTTIPYRFISSQSTGSWTSYKIIYDGSGGGLLLCLIKIDRVTLAIIIQSLVTIGSTQLIDYCLEYTSSSECQTCENGYHLQGGQCYRNIENCFSYYRNICLGCLGYSLLVQNRCLTNCGDECNTSRIVFYQNMSLTDQRK